VLKGRRSGGWLGLTLLALVAAVGCEPPDRPPVLDPDLPEAAVEFLEPDRIRLFRLEPGVIYREIRSGTEPWTVHLLEVDLSRCDLGFRVAGSSDDEGRVPVSELARRAGPDVVAAINGDFYTPEGLPLGIEASGGEVRGRPSHPVFAWRPGADPWIGEVAWSGDSLQVGSWTAVPGAPESRLEVVAGFPALLHDGVWVGDLEQVDRPGFALQRDPRTAVGVDLAGSRLWLVVVDGRRKNVSEGMTLPELARFLQSLGVRQALNLDGGGSSVMVVRGQTVSRPSDPGGERPVVNALMVRRDADFCGDRTPPGEGP